MQPSYTRKQLFGLGFRAGLIASIPATILMILLRLIVGSVSLPDQVASAISVAIPPTTFEYLHTIFGDASKQYLWDIVVIGQCLLLALCAALFYLLASSLSLAKRSPSSLRLQDNQGSLLPLSGIVLAVLLWLLACLVILPVTGAGLFGAQLSNGWLDVMGSLAIVGLLFGLLFVYAQHWLLLRAQQNQQQSSSATNREQRRNLIGTGLKVLGLGAVGALAWRFITAGSSSSVAPSGQYQGSYKPKVTPTVPNYGPFTNVEGLSPEVTPVTRFYVVSKNFTSDPTVSSDGWQLKITGLVERPYTLTYDQLLALPLKQQAETLMCISNPVGGSLMGNAQWEGIPLVDLLQRAGKIRSGATKVVFHGADDYTDSIHLSKALEPTTMVAVRMNGDKLHDNHGFPARMLVPGIYGMKHIKWLQQIEVVDTDYQGYWQRGGWSDPAPVRMTARIDVPHSGQILQANRPSYIAGIAFSGKKGISQVNVTVDNGKTWQSANLKQPLSELTWVLWELPWQPKAGNYTITAYAIDKEGNVQNPLVADSLPDGASGYHSVPIEVR